MNWLRSRPSIEEHGLQVVGILALTVLFFEIVPSLHAYVIFRLLRSVVEIFFFIIIPSLYITRILASFSKKSLSAWAFLSIACGLSFVWLPIFLAVEYLFLGQCYNIILFFLTLSLAFFIGNRKKIFSFALHPWPTVYLAKVSAPSNPWLWAGIIEVVLIVLLFSAYYTLPDPDSYDWIERYRNFMTSGAQLNIQNRPLFYFFLYIFNQQLHIDLYAVFKYVMPSLTLLLLLPAWQLAKTYTQKSSQLLILLLPFASSSTILYLQTSIPQTVALLLSFYVFYWLLLSYKAKNTFYYYLAGVLSFTIFFYHETGAFLSLPWVVVTLLYYRKTIWHWLLQDKMRTFFLGGSLLWISTFLKPIWHFWSYWINHIVEPSYKGFNWLFPAYYINVDQNSVGWAGISGVLKYYTYYVGPFLIVLGTVTICLLVLKKHFRYFFRDYIKDPVFIICPTVFLFFFLIAEILPRFFNQAFLPERAWLLGGLFLSACLIPLLEWQKTSKFLLHSISFICIAISIGGALYVNNAKQYTIPNYELTSFRWITKNLPAKRIILVNYGSALQRYHTESTILPINNELYCTQNVRDSTSVLQKLEAAHVINQVSTITQENYYNAILSAIKNELPKENILSLLDKYQAASLDVAEQERKNIHTLPIYIYYIQPDSRNPLLSRPYIQKRLDSSCAQPIMPNLPDYYREIYNDYNRVIIWEAL